MVDTDLQMYFNPAIIFLQVHIIHCVRKVCINARIHCTRHTVLGIEDNLLTVPLCSSSDGEHSRGHSPVKVVPSSYHSYPQLGTREKTSPSHIPGNLTMLYLNLSSLQPHFCY